jgi:hypothetical protein
MDGKTPSVDYNLIVEIYDGTSWSEIADLNTAKLGRCNGAGTQLRCFSFFSETFLLIINTAETESYNGTSWTEINDLAYGKRSMLGGSGLKQLPLQQVVGLITLHQLTANSKSS